LEPTLPPALADPAGAIAKMMDRCVHPRVHNDPLSGRRVGSAAASASTGPSAAAAGRVEADSRGGLARNRIRASAEIAAVAGTGGVTRLPVLASQVPLVLRRTPEAVYVVGGAAGPIGGDELDLRISVGAGAFLRVRTAAASIALPGPDGLESVLRVTIDVEAGARLEYLPEPVVASAGARHATIIRVTLAEGASLLLRDELLLGRYGETGGAARSVLNVDYAGRPLLRQSLEVSGADAVATGPALLAGHRAVGTALWVDPATGEARDAGAAAREAQDADAVVAVMPLAGPGILVTALANDAVALRRRLSATPPTRTPTGLELGLQGFDLAGVGAELLEGGALADAGQGPADGLGPAAGDADGDQRVERLQVLLAEPGHDRGEAGAAAPRAGRARAQLDDRLSLARFGGAGRELEGHPSREPVELVPELVQGLAVPVVERGERLPALRFVVRRLDDHPGQQLPRLDLRLIAVLEHLDPLDRRARKALVYLLGELLADAGELGCFHDGLTSELRM
jgi:urease accessory protein